MRYFLSQIVDRDGNNEFLVVYFNCDSWTGHYTRESKSYWVSSKEIVAKIKAPKIKASRSGSQRKQYDFDTNLNEIIKKYSQ